MSFRRQSPSRGRTDTPPPPSIANRALSSRNNSRNALVHSDMHDEQPNDNVLTLKFEVPSACKSGQRSPVLRQRQTPQQPYFHEDIMGWETDIEHDGSRMISGMRSTHPSNSHYLEPGSRYNSRYGTSRRTSTQGDPSSYAVPSSYGRSGHPSSGMHQGPSSIYTGTPHTINRGSQFESTRNMDDYNDEGALRNSGGRADGFQFPTPDTFETDVQSGQSSVGEEKNDCGLIDCEGEDGDVYVCKRRYAKKEEPKPMRFAECYENKFKELDSVRCEYEKQLWCLQKQLDKERRCTMEEFTSMQQEYCQYDKALEMYALRVAMDQIAISKANLEHEYADQIHGACPDTPDPQHPCCSSAICPPKQSNFCPPCPPPAPIPTCLPADCCAPGTNPCEEEPALKITYKQFTVACSVAAVIAFGLCVRFFCILKCLIFGCDR